jgi:hypothetical protein
MKEVLALAALALLITKANALASDKADPSDVNIGKPFDLSQDNFRVIRIHCAGEWPDDFHMRAYCEHQQFEGIRKLRGDTRN